MHSSTAVALAAVCSKAVFLLLLIRCWLLPPLRDSILVPCFVVSYFVSILVLQSSWWGRESWLLAKFVFLVSRDCCVALPHDATGLSAVCKCGISRSYSLTIFYWFLIFATALIFVVASFGRKPLSLLHNQCVWTTCEHMATIWAVKIFPLDINRFVICDWSFKLFLQHYT